MIARRRFLGLAAAGAVLGVAGCSSCPGNSAAPGAVARPRPVIVPASSATKEFITAGAVAAPGDKGPFTVANLLEAPSFFVAHRGSGDNWPEHTMRAYQGAAAAGLKAIEVSVSATQDGVLVCHHDLNTQRLTGIDLTIASAPYAALEPLRNDARAWLGPATSLEPIALLTDVLDSFAASHVIFLEDKPGTNADEILALLENYPAAREHVVWKQPAASRGHELAAASGYTTFGYMVSRDQDKMPELIPRTDLLGIHYTAPEAMIRQVVASGKPVLAWELHRRSEYARLQDLGVRGFICANIRYVLHQEEPLSEDGFAAGRRGTGDLPWAADAVWDGQPAFADGAVRISGPDQSGYVLGSMAEAVNSPDWEFEFELRWPSGLPAAGPGAGVAFGQDADAPYRPGSAPKVSGYSLDFAADGTLALYRHDAGTADPVRLAEAGSPAPRAGEWVKFVVSLRPWSIGVRRDGAGTAGWSVSAEDTLYGGAWMTLLKNYDAGPPVEFRAVRVRAVAAQEGCGNVG